MGNSLTFCSRARHFPTFASFAACAGFYHRLTSYGNPRDIHMNLVGYDYTAISSDAWVVSCGALIIAHAAKVTNSGMWSNNVDVFAGHTLGDMLQGRGAALWRDASCV